MNVFKKNKKNILIGGVFILAVLIFAIIENYESNKLIKGNNNFTIGKYTESKAAKGAILYYYTFKVNDKWYQKAQETGNKGKKGKLYFVIYNPTNPDKSRLLMNIPVPDSIKEAPKNGWKELPIPHDEKMIKKGFR